jgi:hypothetical protein
MVRLSSGKASGIRGGISEAVVCQKSIAGSCGAPVVEVEQSAEPLAAFDRRIPIGGSHRLLGGREACSSCPAST